jgi:putative transcriptional regulator
MTRRNHPQPETLISYVSGTLPLAISGVVACHISLCPQCARDAHRLAIIGKSLLDRMESASAREIPESRIAAVLADPFLAISPEQPVLAGPRDPVLPNPLAQYLGMSSDEIPWKRVVKGVRQYWVRLPAEAGQMRLLRLDPGKVLLEHTHRGMEVTLVLKGIYGDHTGQYVRGDVIEWAEETLHQPRVFGDQECICVVATERAPHYSRLAARLLRPLLGF